MPVCTMHCRLMYALLGALLQDTDNGIAARPLTPDQLSELRNIYDLFDANQNHLLGVAETRRVADGCGMTASEVQGMFGLGEGSNQSVSFEVFVATLCASYTR